jgi:phage-related protein
MAYDIGPKIGIEGEAEFRKNINNINMSMRTLKTEMEAVASQFDENDKSQEAYAAKNEVLTKQIEMQKKKLEELSKGLTAAKEKYGENDKVTQGWQQAVNKATAELNKMERELDDNTKAMSELGKETEQTTGKTGKFSTAISNIGKGLANAGKVAAKAAVAGITAVGTAAVSAAAGAFKLAQEVGKTADDLMTLSNQTGISAQQLQEWDYAMRFIDVDMDTMTKSMARLIRSMDNANKGSKDTVEAFEKLGVSWTDSAGNMRNNQDVFYDIIDTLGKIENETERDALAMRLFGRSAQELNPLIKAGSAELARLSKEAHKVGAVLSDDALEAAGNFDDMMQTLEASTKGLVANLGVAVIPAVSEVVNAVSGVVPKITQAIKTGDWSGAGKAVTDGLKGLLDKLMEALPGISQMASTIIGSLASAIAVAIPQVIPPLIEATMSLIDTLINIIIEHGPMLIQTGIDALVTLIKGIVNALPRLIEAAITVILTLVDTLLEALPDLIPVAIEAIVVFAKGLIDALPKLIEKIPLIVETIVNTIVENLPLLVDAAIEIILALVDAIVGNLPLMLEASYKVMGAIVKGLIQAIPELLGAIPKIFQSVREAFANLNWGELGKNIINGIANGVKSAAGNLATGLKDAATNGFNKIKDFLGIRSPSRLMRDQVGKMIGLGIAEGISDSSKQVNAAIDGLNKQINAGVNVELHRTGNLIVNVPLSMDGQIITKSTGRFQVRRNRAYSRSIGVMAT